MRSLVPALLAACALAACGGGSQEVDATVATVVPVRGATALEGSSVARVARASSESAVTTADRSLARVSLDLGPELLLGPSTELSVLDAMTVQLARGKVFAQTLPGEQLALRFAHGSLRCSDASLSAELEGGTLTVYVVRGEVAWTRGDERGIASPGEELVLGPSSAETRAAVLWHDWTGGLARPGPGDASGPAGVGTLEARVPDEIGLARWPLVIRRLDVRVRIDEDLAVTEVDQLFFNPASETVEGLYRIRVPEGAVLQRFAVDRDDRLVDGYVRERAQARRSYEEQVYRGSTEDPALLEWDAPGSYRARIYPIHPGETRRIVIRYAEWLRPPEEGAPRLYRYPMGGGESAPHIQELSISADVSNAGAERVRAGMGAQVEKGAVRIRRSDFRPHADFWMELVGGEAHPQRAWVADYEPPARAPDSPAMPNEADKRDFFYLPLVLPVSLAGGARADGLDLVVLADVSAATDRSHLELGRSVVESLTAHLDASDRVAVVTSDLTIRSVVPGDPALVEATPENVERLLDGLARAPAGGATDLGQALEDAAALLDPARPSAIVYVGDGAPTVGELRAEGLLERLARLPHPIRLYAVGVGSEANLDLLEALTRGGGLALRVEERAQAADAALRVLAHLQRPVAHDVVVDLGNGIENAFPRRPMDAVLGEVFPVVGRVRGELPSVARVSMKIGGREIAGHEIPLEVVETDASTDLRLRWAAERLRQLLLDGASREEVVELGTRYGLITPFTSYYVPSRSELARMGALSSALVDRPLLEVGGPSTARRIAEGVAAIALGPLSIAGCSVLNEEEGAAPSVPLEEGQAEGSATPEAAEAPAAPAPPPEPAAQASAGAHADVAALRTPAGTAEAEPAPAAAPAPRGAEYAREAAAAADLPEVAEVYAPPADVAPSSGWVDESQVPSSGGGGYAPARRMARARRARAPVPLDDGEASLGAGGGESEFGAGGLVLGGAGRGRGVGLGRLGTIGGGARPIPWAYPAPHVRLGELEVRGGALSREVVGRVVQRHINEIRHCYEQRLMQNPALRGTVEVSFAIVGGGTVPSASVLSSTLADAQVEGCIVAAVQRWAFPPPNAGRPVGVIVPFALDSSGGSPEAPVRVVGTTNGAAHRARRCSDAADLSLDDRRALWRERLSSEGGAGGWVRLYDEAIRQCEAPTWRDRRAFLTLVLERAGSVDAMLAVHRHLRDPAAREFVRAQVLRRVRTPEDLRSVRVAFGLGSEVDWTLVDTILARAATESVRIRMLRRLVSQFPNSFELKLRLLAALERAERAGEAKRLADRMRADPMADAGVRTAIGEMFLRMGREDEARRVFSEIVEFAPLDELARRRLGDLYRAHGWYEDAYRQYQTLSEIRPDDPSVLLLLAQAAAGAGRVDEALRLERRLMQTAQPGAAQGIARTALLWSSVRFARLRKAARDANDRERLEALARRMRQSGILREAKALRVTLVWSHPDAQLALWASHPGLSATRPTDITPEYGLEAFEVEEQEPGTYTFMVRRTADETGELTPVSAQLVVVWNEGRDDERIDIVDLRFDRTRTTYAWTLTGRALTETRVEGR